MPLALIWVSSDDPAICVGCGQCAQLLRRTKKDCAAKCPKTSNPRIANPSRPSSNSIDIGTTYSCVATYEGTNVEIIANEQGSFTTPSFVSFTDKERLIGEAAKNNAAMNPINTVFDAK